jgi:hypothetical protein
MKTAMMLAGRYRSNLTRPPIKAPTGAMLEKIRQAISQSELEPAPGVDNSASAVMV